MAREIISAHPKMTGDGFNQRTLMGSVAAAASDPAETRFETRVVMINEASAITNTTGEMTAKQPADRKSVV